MVSDFIRMKYHPFPFDFHGKFIIGLLTARKVKGRVYHNLCKMNAASILQSLAIRQRDLIIPFFFSLVFHIQVMSPKLRKLKYCYGTQTQIYLLHATELCRHNMISLPFSGIDRLIYF